MILCPPHAEYAFLAISNLKSYTCAALAYVADEVANHKKHVPQMGAKNYWKEPGTSPSSLSSLCKASLSGPLAISVTRLFQPMHRLL